MVLVCCELDLSFFLLTRGGAMATISYNMVTYGLPDVCTLTVPQSGLQPLGSGVYIRQTACN